MSSVTCNDTLAVETTVSHESPISACVDVLTELIHYNYRVLTEDGCLPNIAKFGLRICQLNVNSIS